MCRIDSQLKKIDTFETFNSWNTLHLLLGINNNFSFDGFPTFPFLSLFLQLYKRKYIF